MSLFSGIFGRDERKVADASALTYSAIYGLDARSKTGLPVSEFTALRVAALYACCRVICEDVGKLPLKVIREDQDGVKRVMYDHPLYRVLYRAPNEWQTSMEWRMTMLLHALLCKGGYSYINRSKQDGSILELIPLMPGNVKIRQDSAYHVSYEVTDPFGRIAVLDRSDVHVIHGLSWNGVSALDLVSQGAEAIGLAIAAEEAQARLHANGAKPGGVLSTAAVLTEEQIVRIKEQFAMNYSGVSNAFKTLLLDNGLKFEPWQMTGVDAQQLETRKFQTEEVCRLMRVFPQMIGASSATPTYASAESFFGAHVNHTLMPWVTLWEQAILRDLFTELEVRQGLEAKFMLQALLRGSAAERATFYHNAVTDGWMTRNEVRRLEDLDPKPGLDQVLTPLNMGGTPPKPGPEGAPPAPPPAPPEK